MTDIVLITNAYKPIHEYIIDYLNQYLIKQYSVKHYNADCNVNDIIKEQCECILFYNQYPKENLAKLRGAFPSINFVLLYCYSDVLKEYPLSVAAYDDYIMFIDNPNDEYAALTRYIHINKLSLPIPNYNADADADADAICIEGDCSFVMNNLDLINKLSIVYPNVILLTNNSKVENFINHKIDLKISDFNTITECVKKSKLVIGSGLSILLAIKFAIPCLIVGKYGYGRYLTENNFLSQWENAFSGRIGACRNEMIPFEFIKNDISELYTYCQKEQNSQLLKRYFEQINSVENIFLKIINNNIESRVDNSYYILNPDYTFKIIQDANQYLIYDIHTMQMKYLITNDEYRILNHFAKKNSMANVCSQINDYAYDEVYEYLKEIIKNKLLIKS